MSKKGGAQVTPVDPVAASNAQSAANIQTAQAQQKLNMVNTHGPDGSVTYAADPNAPGGYSQTTSLSPTQQGIYDASNATQLGAVNLANGQLGRVGQALGQSLNTSGLPALTGGVGGWGQPTNTYSGQSQYGGGPMGGKTGGGGAQTMPAASANYSAPNGAGPTGGKIAGAANAMPSPGGVQSGAPNGAGPSGGKTGGQGQAMPGQIAQAIAHAQPSQQQAQPSPLQSMASGVHTTFNQGGPLQYGFNPGQQVQGQVGPTDLNAASQQAQNAVYGQAASRLDPQFAQQQHQLEARLASQGLSQNSDAYHSAMDDFNRGKNDAYNQANFSSIGAGNDAAQQLFGQSLAQGQFANSAAGQQYAQNQGQAAFNNATAGQDYGQNQGLAQFGNEATQLQAGLQNQAFNQGLANAQLANTSRQQGLQEQAYIQNQPINQMSALLGMGQVAMPTGVQYSPTQVGNTDVLGAYALNQQGQQFNAQQKNAAAGGLMGGLFSLGSAAMMSDRRSKRDIRRIGTRPDGLGVYLYRYRGEPEEHFGVMAQEAKALYPRAVIERPDGMLAVHYSLLEAA